MIDYTTIREKVETEIGTNFSTCPVKYENVPLSPHDATTWVAIFDRQTFSESTGMAEDTFHLGGTIIINIYTELNTGTAEGRAIANELSNLLSSQDVDGLKFQTPELRPGEPNDSWYQHNLLIPYTTVTGNEADC